MNLILLFLHTDFQRVPRKSLASSTINQTMTSSTGSSPTASTSILSQRNLNGSSTSSSRITTTITRMNREEYLQSFLPKPNFGPNEIITIDDSDDEDDGHQEKVEKDTGSRGGIENYTPSIIKLIGPPKNYTISSLIQGVDLNQSINATTDSPATRNSFNKNHDYKCTICHFRTGCGKQMRSHANVQHAGVPCPFLKLPKLISSSSPSNVSPGSSLSSKVNNNTLPVAIPEQDIICLDD